MVNRRQRQARRPAWAGRLSLRLERLEDRTLMDATVLHHPEAILRPDFGPKGIAGQPDTGTPPPGPVNVPVNDPTEDGNSVDDTHSETALVVGSGTDIVSAYNDSLLSSSHYTGYSVSTDGGQTFTDKGAPPASSSGDAGDPVLARDNVTGRVYLATLSLSNSAILWVFHSDDDGQTFSAPVNAAPGGSSPSYDKEWLAVDNSGGPGQGTSTWWCVTSAAATASCCSAPRTRARPSGPTGACRSPRAAAAMCRGRG